MELINKLNWRYATKAMNRQVVPQGKIDNIIEAISLAPTSSGLQPFEVIVITNQEIKDQIKPIAWGQSVVSDCSHLAGLRCLGSIIPRTASTGCLTS